MSKKFLFAASTGGHLAELVRLADRFDASDDSVWVTFDTSQSRSILTGRRVVYVPYIRPRDVKGVIEGARISRRLVREETFDCAVSTGAALALSVLPQTRIAGIRSVYIESVSRLDGPSMSGRLIALMHAAELYTQHDSWADRRWRVIPSVLESFKSSEAMTDIVTPKLFVTLGTIQGYRFDRLVDAVLQSGLANAETVWQLGATSRTGLPGRVRSHMGADDFENAVKEADLVITHAGVGTILQSLELGKHPIVVPRSKSHSEHVDNHQFQIAQKVQQMGVGEVLTPEQFSVDRLISASKRYVTLVGASVRSEANS